ncbi:MAG: 50S ribosomal protein L23 [Clostridia bacterium]|nr:50S ribosomal protein L23 [Clostridia bacterium]
MTMHDIIIKPIVSEKSMDQLADRKYTFKVALNANKIEIRKAVEQIFGVKVEKVTTSRVRGKMKRMGVHMGKRPDWKKATVKLTADSKTIEFFEGMA